MTSDYLKCKSKKKLIFPRLFVVGCPRSGTTLLQSLLSAHPLIFSFPESHFFPKVLSKRKVKRVFGIASEEAGKSIVAFLKILERQNLLDSIPVTASRAKSYADSFVNILDMVTLENGKKLWLEKTPQHLHYVKPIEKYIRNTKFIHVVRNGEDVVASLYEVTHKYPKIWGGPRTIDQCVKRWIEDVNITISYISRRNHMAIKYEELVDDPTKILKSACDFIGVEYHLSMLKKYGVLANKILIKGENWKQEVKRSIKNNNGKKFLYVFNREKREYVRKLLENSTSLAFYRKLRYGKLITE